MPFYVSPEQVIKDKADYARKGIARGRSVIVLQYADGLLFVAENPSRALHKISEIYDRIAFAAVGQVQRVREPPRRRRPPRRPARLLLRPSRRHRPQPRQRLRPDPRHDLHRDAEALRGRDRRRRGRRDARTTTSSTGSPSTARSATSTASWRWAARPTRSPTALKERWSEGMALEDALALAVELLAAAPVGGPPRTAPRPPSPARSTPGQLEVAVLDRDRPRRKFRRINGPRLAELLGVDDDSDDAAGDPERRPGSRPPLPARRPADRVGVPRVATWTGGSSGSRPSTASPARSAGSGGSLPDEVARYLFRRVVSWGRSSNVFLRNGARLYLDVGQPPRVRHGRVRRRSRSSSPTTRRASGSSRTCSSTPSSGSQDEGIAGDIYLFKNNTDSAGNSYGCHENYLVGRHGEFSRLADVLIPFLVTRQIICGAGQGAADPARRGLLPEPARRAHLGGRLERHHPLPADHQHPRRAARRRRALPPAARDRRRLEHERDHDACSRSARPTWCCG